MLFGKALVTLAFVISVLLAGCRPNLFQPIYADSNGVRGFLVKMPTLWAFSCDFDSEQNRNTVRKGFAYWDDMTHRHLFQEVKCDGVTDRTGVLVKRSRKSSPLNDKDWVILAYTQRHMGVGGLTGAEVTFMPEWDDADNTNSYEAVVRHEVGHVLGFEHFPWKRCLMNADITSYEGAVPPEDGTVKGICREESILFHSFYGN